MLDIDDRPYVRNLLRGMVELRDEEMQRRKDLDVPEGQEVSYVEPTVEVGDAIEQSDLIYEEGNEDEWVEAQTYLHDKDLITVQGNSDQDGLYSSMQFADSNAVDLAKEILA